MPSVCPQVYIVLTPEFEGYFNGKSLPAYGRMGKVLLLLLLLLLLLAGVFD